MGLMSFDVHKKMVCDREHAKSNEKRHMKPQEDEKALNDLTVLELKRLAEKKGIDLGSATRKKEIIKIIKEG